MKTESKKEFMKSDNLGDWDLEFKKLLLKEHEKKLEIRFILARRTIVVAAILVLFEIIVYLLGLTKVIDLPSTPPYILISLNTAIFGFAGLAIRYIYSTPKPFFS